MERYSKDPGSCPGGDACFHIKSIVLVPWFSCLGGYLPVPDDYPLVLGCEEHVSPSCPRSLVVRALERYSKDPGSCPGGDACFHINSIVLVPWFSCLGGYLSVPDDYPLVLGCEEHVSPSCPRSLVVRALERYSKDPGSCPGGDACFHINSIHKVYSQWECMDE